MLGRPDSLPATPSNAGRHVVGWFQSGDAPLKERGELPDVRCRRPSALVLGHDGPLASSAWWGGRLRSAWPGGSGGAG